MANKDAISLDDLTPQLGIPFDDLSELLGIPMDDLSAQLNSRQSALLKLQSRREKLTADMASIDAALAALKDGGAE